MAEGLPPFACILPVSPVFSQGSAKAVSGISACGKNLQMSRSLGQVQKGNWASLKPGLPLNNLCHISVQVMLIALFRWFIVGICWEPYFHICIFNSENWCLHANLLAVKGLPLQYSFIKLFTQEFLVVFLNLPDGDSICWHTTSLIWTHNLWNLSFRRL